MISKKAWLGINELVKHQTIFEEGNLIKKLNIYLIISNFYLIVFNYWSSYLKYEANFSNFSYQCRYL